RHSFSNAMIFREPTGGSLSRVRLEATRVPTVVGQGDVRNQLSLPKIRRRCQREGRGMSWPELVARRSRWPLNDHFTTHGESSPPRLLKFRQTVSRGPEEMSAFREVLQPLAVAADAAAKDGNNCARFGRFRLRRQCPWRGSFEAFHPVLFQL